MPSVFITQTNRYSLAVGTTQNVNDAQAKQLYDDGAAIASELAILPTDTTPSWWRTFIGTVQSWVTGNFVALTGAQSIAGNKTFTGVTAFNQSVSVSGGALSVAYNPTTTAEHRTASGARVVDVTAGNAAVTVAASKRQTLISSPAAAITVTLAAAAGDGEVRRITFGAACTVTWAATGATVSSLAKTSFNAGDSIELVYNQTAGTPTNSTATTWYPF